MDFHVYHDREILQKIKIWSTPLCFLLFRSCYAIMPISLVWIHDYIPFFHQLNANVSHNANLVVLLSKYQIRTFKWEASSPIFTAIHTFLDYFKSLNDPRSFRRDKGSWDKDLPEQILPKRESWLKDLPHLAALKIPRNYCPSNFGEVKQYELHNFYETSETSFNGYGACSNLWTMAQDRLAAYLSWGRQEWPQQNEWQSQGLNCRQLSPVCNGEVVKRVLRLKICN